MKISAGGDNGLHFKPGSDARNNYFFRFFSPIPDGAFPDLDPPG